MPKNSILDWDAVPGNNTDIAGIGIQGTNAVSNFSNALRTMMSQIRTGVDYKAIASTKSTGYTAVLNDNNAIVRFTGTYTLALTAAATLGANWHMAVVADGGNVTIDPNGSETINGATTIVIPNGYSTVIWCDGTSFFAEKDYLRLDPVTDIASAATADIGAVPSQNLRVTGTTTITSLGTVASGTFRRLRFAGALTLTYNATSLILPGAADITTAAGDFAEFVSDGSGNWRCSNYTKAATLPAEGNIIPDFVQGLTLANNSSDASNDIDISAGTAKAGQKVVTNSGTFTKRLDANWSAGSGNGGLDAGSKANSTTYHMHSIVNNTTLAFDALFSLSATAPTVPSGWTGVQRVGSVVTDSSGNIRLFTQAGSRVAFTTFVVEATENSLQALSPITLSSVPSVIPVRPILSATLFMSSATSISGYTLGLTDGGNITAGGIIDILTDVNTLNNTTGSAATEVVLTNTSRQIGRRTAAVGNNPTAPTFTLRCHGWTDVTIPRIG